MLAIQKRSDASHLRAGIKIERAIQSNVKMHKMKRFQFEGVCMGMAFRDSFLLNTKRYLDGLCSIEKASHQFLVASFLEGVTCRDELLELLL